MDSYEILVIVLSITLAFFLIAGIAVLLKVRQLVKKFEGLVDSAKITATNVGDITTKLNSAANASMFGAAAIRILSLFKKGSK